MLNTYLFNYLFAPYQTQFKKLYVATVFIFVYVYDCTTGSNPLFGGLKSTKSILGWSYSSWVEGEGMLHALYFKKQSDGSCTLVYNNRHVETGTYKLEKQSNKPLFLPAVKGDSLAVLSSLMLNRVSIIF